MAAFNFPNSPSTNDTYTLNSVTYQYDGTWEYGNFSRVIFHGQFTYMVA